MKTILLKFSGPQQSWGTSSFFNTRHTDFYPSKSGVIGLIAASLGISRDDDQKISILNKLDFAVRIDQQGKLAMDYHTVIRPEIKSKLINELDRTNKNDFYNVEYIQYVTHRYYLEDALFIVALSGEENLVNKVYEGLQKPYFQQFLGKRSFPVLYDFILGIYDEAPIELLKKYKPQFKNYYLQAEYKRLKNPKIKMEIFADYHLLKKWKRLYKNK